MEGVDFDYNVTDMNNTLDEMNEILTSICQRQTGHQVSG